VLVPFGAGGATDILARVFSERLAQSLGQPFTVENRGGAAAQRLTAETALYGEIIRAANIRMQ
jgi:tripartite-type tricarboxylate transporter receptor subunit TctC